MHTEPLLCSRGTADGVEKGFHFAEKEPSVGELCNNGGVQDLGQREGAAQAPLSAPSSLTCHSHLLLEPQMGFLAPYPSREGGDRSSLIPSVRTY